MLYETILPFYKRKDWKACHRLLDKAGAAGNGQDRSSITFWRAATFEAEGRYREALDQLVTHRNDFDCKSGLSELIAKIYDKMGQSDKAIQEMRSAPFGAEMDRFPALVLDAIYFYCYVLAKDGRTVPPNLLGAIPEDYRTMIETGILVNKDYLRGMIRSKARLKGSPTQ